MKECHSYQPLRSSTCLDSRQRCLNIDKTRCKLQEAKFYPHSFKCIGVEGSRNIMKNLKIPGVPVVWKREYNSGDFEGGSGLGACRHVRPKRFNRSANSLYVRSVVSSATTKHVNANYDTAHCQVRGNRRFERRNCFHFLCR
jgi:hypothetical protein